MTLDPETIDKQLALLAAHRRTLAALLQQQTLLGGAAYAAPGVLNGIEEARVNIRRVKTILRDNELAVDDYPDDLPPPNQVLETIRRSISQEQIVVFERLVATIRQLITHQNSVSEIKNVHNMMHNLKNSLSTVSPYIRTTKIKGRKPDLNFVESVWRISVVNCLQSLRNFASKDIKYMGPILIITESELSGPRWIIGLISLQSNIQSCFIEENFLELYNLWEELESECDRQMIEIDKELLTVVNKIDRLTSYILGVIGDDPAI